MSDVDELVRENERLQALVNELQTVLGTVDNAPPEFGLTEQQNSIFRALSYGTVVPRDALFKVLYPNGSLVDDKIVDVIVSKIRAKIKASGMVIRVYYKRGYELVCPK